MSPPLSVLAQMAHLQAEYLHSFVHTQTHCSWRCLTKQTLHARQHMPAEVCTFMVMIRRTFSRICCCCRVRWL